MLSEFETWPNSKPKTKSWKWERLLWSLQNLRGSETEVLEATQICLYREIQGKAITKEYNKSNYLLSSSYFLPSFYRFLRFCHGFSYAWLMIPKKEPKIMPHQYENSISIEYIFWYKKNKFMKDDTSSKTRPYKQNFVHIVHLDTWRLFHPHGVFLHAQRHSFPIKKKGTKSFTWSFHKFTFQIISN